jgi:FAD/FMN-containing dehydrogenase
MTTASPALDDVRATIRGRIVTPGDDDYDELRGVSYGGNDRHPAAIVRVADAADVAHVIRFSRETGMELAVRSGGHSGAGHGTTEGGIVIDVRDLRDLDIDVDGRTAWAGTGLTAIDLLTAVTNHALTIGFGDAGSVGISGITLGGGIGYLVRKHGMTIDNLLAGEIVTADGELRRTDAETDPDLFWAIRGGGGNFGVATRLQYRLHPLAGIVGGILVLPATPETVAGFIAASDAAPEELSTIANVMPAPPMPFLPESAVGQVVILAMLVYAGDAEAGERAMAPFRSLAKPLADLVKPMSYPEMFPPEDESYKPKVVGHTMFIDKVDLDDARTIMATLGQTDAEMRFAQIRVLGGAMARVPEDATAFAHRKSEILVTVGAFYETDAERLARQAWVDGFARALHQTDDGAYVNFLGDEGEARIRAAYPGGTWHRLAAIKARYDPANVFRLNQNIPPAHAGA